MIALLRVLLLLIAGSFIFGGAGNVFTSSASIAVAASIEAPHGDLRFRGWLLMTSDPDWKSRWNDPGKNAPTFRQTREIGLGEEITVLIFYANPSVDTQGDIYLECDIRVIKPDGEYSYEKEGLVCADERLAGPRENIRLAYVQVDFVGEFNDPYGTWGVDVIIRDMMDGSAVSLQTSFILVDRTTFAHENSFPLSGRNRVVLSNMRRSVP